MEIELMSDLHSHFGIPMSIGRVIHKTLSNAKKGGDITIDDLSTFID
jgi:hypothetical protein